MSQRLRNLLDKRNKGVTDVRAVLDEADAKTDGKLSGEQEEKIRSLETDIESFDKSIEIEERNIEREKRTRIPLNGAPISPTAKGGDGEENAEDDEKKRAKMEREGFVTFLRNGEYGFQDAKSRGLVAGVMTQGGSLTVPQQLVNEILREAEPFSEIESLCRVFNVPQAQSLGVPTMSGSSEASYVGEEETGDEIALVTGKRELVPTEMSAKAKLSNKLIEQSTINIESEVTGELGRAFQRRQERAYATGTGANQALGLFTASDDGIPTSRDVTTGNLVTGPTFDGIIEAIYALKTVYLPRATLLTHRLIVKLLRKIKDDNNQYIWVPGVNSSEPDRVWDVAIKQSDNCPSTIAANAYIGILGDFNYYWIVKSLAYRIQKLNELYAEENKVGWIARTGHDAMPVLAEAFVRLKLPAS